LHSHNADIHVFYDLTGVELRRVVVLTRTRATSATLSKHWKAHWIKFARHIIVSFESAPWYISYPSRYLSRLWLAHIPRRLLGLVFLQAIATAMTFSPVRHPAAPVRRHIPGYWWNMQLGALYSLVSAVTLS